MIKTIINDDEKFLQILRGLNKQFYHKVVTTNEIENYINIQSGINFNAVFDQYLRTSQIPVLEYFITDHKLQYRFINCNDNFTMPIKMIGIEGWLSPNTFWQSYDLKNMIDEVNIVKSSKIVYLNYIQNLKTLGLTLFLNQKSSIPTGLSYFFSKTKPKTINKK